MLSPGQWHRKIPKEEKANLRKRQEILRAAEDNPEIQRGLMEMCRQDCLLWVNLFVWQFNPDLRQKGPFISYDFQDAAIVGGRTIVGDTVRFQEGILQSMVDQEDVRWQKSRYVGSSWIVLMTIVWLCLFQENIKAFAISKDADAVDVIDDPDSLFWKVRFILDHLPKWMYDPLNSKTKKGLIKFPSGNILSGDANAASSGVGGRATIMLVDEFGQFDNNGAEIYSMTTDTCNCRVFVFTHKDQSGMAYRLCFDPKYNQMREIVTHWSQHPERRKGLYRFNDPDNRVEFFWPDGMWKTDACFDYAPEFSFVREVKPSGGPCVGIRSPWYDKQCRRREERDIAMNLDIDPRGAGDQFFDAYRIGVLKAEHGWEPRWRGSLSYDKKNGKPIELQEDRDGLIKLWINPKGPCELPMMRAGAGVDISAGVGSSPSCISVMNARTGEKVLEYANAHIFQPDFAIFVVALLRLFKDENGNHPMLVWEIQYAQVFDSKIRELGYRPFFIRRDEDISGRPRDNKGRAGQSTSGKSFFALMTEYRAALYDGRCINRSESALDECLNFVYTGTGEGVAYKPKGQAKMDGSGAKIHHGDMVVADALANKMIRDLGYEGPEKEETKSPRPGSWEFREWLHSQREREEEEVWA